MITFDDILKNLIEILQNHRAFCENISPFLVNRDINGRVRIILDEKHEKDKLQLKKFGEEIVASLGCHVHAKDLFLYQSNFANFLNGETSKFAINDDFNGKIWIVDRTITESNWADAAKKPQKKPARVTFFSIKGGVGRSSVVASTAIELANGGKNVLVVDMDIESPGISFSLLEADRRLPFGITDWLVEDLVNNGDALMESMVANPPITEQGEIFVLPACGSAPGEYTSKLGRVLMPKIHSGGRREKWSERINRLISEVEQKYKIDYTLIDSRAGIDEFASVCVTELGASFIFLFAVDAEQTWGGYKILVEHWEKVGGLRNIREKLQIVGALVPESNAGEYRKGLETNSWNFFIGNIYDSIEPGNEDGFSFDTGDKRAPHFPIYANWDRDMFAPKDFLSAVKKWGFSGTKNFIEEMLNEEGDENDAESNNS